MKFLDWVLIILALTLSISAINSLGLIPQGSQQFPEDAIEVFESREEIDSTGKIIKNSEEGSMAFKVANYQLNKDYTAAGIIGDAQSLSTEGDFLTGMVMFTEIYSKGTFEASGLYDDLTRSGHMQVRYLTYDACISTPGYKFYSAATNACLIENIAAKKVKYLILVPIFFAFGLATLQIITGRNLKQMQ